jgi:hypothetical protein
MTRCISRGAHFHPRFHNFKPFRQLRAKTQVVQCLSLSAGVRASVRAVPPTRGGSDDTTPIRFASALALGLRVRRLEPTRTDFEFEEMIVEPSENQLDASMQLEE